MFIGACFVSAYESSVAGGPCTCSFSINGTLVRALDILLARADGSNLGDNDMPATSASPHVNVTFCESMEDAARIAPVKGATRLDSARPSLASLGIRKCQLMVVCESIALLCSLNFHAVVEAFQKFSAKT